MNVCLFVIVSVGSTHQPWLCHEPVRHKQDVCCHEASLVADDGNGVACNCQASCLNNSRCRGSGSGLTTCSAPLSCKSINLFRIETYCHGLLATPILLVFSRSSHVPNHLRLVKPIFFTFEHQIINMSPPMAVLFTVVVQALGGDHPISRP